VLPYAIGAVVAAVAMTAGRAHLALLVAASVVVAGLVRAGIAALDRATIRRRADSWIRMHPRCDPLSDVVAARMNELASPRLSRTLAKSVRRSVELSFERTPRLSTVLNKPAVRREAHLLGALAERLDRGAAHPCGVLMTLDLLTECGSPLYADEGAEQLHQTILHILDVSNGPGRRLESG
jgi:hypothetical protein